MKQYGVLKSVAVLMSALSISVAGPVFAASSGAEIKPSDWMRELQAERLSPKQHRVIQRQQKQELDFRKALSKTLEKQLAKQLAKIEKAAGPQKDFEIEIHDRAARQLLTIRRSGDVITVTVCSTAAYRPGRKGMVAYDTGKQTGPVQGFSIDVKTGTVNGYRLPTTDQPCGYGKGDVPVRFLLSTVSGVLQSAQKSAHSKAEKAAIQAVLSGVKTVQKMWE